MPKYLLGLTGLLLCLSVPFGLLFMMGRRFGFKVAIEGFIFIFGTTGIVLLGTYLMYLAGWIIK